MSLEEVPSNSYCALNKVAYSLWEEAPIMSLEEAPSNSCCALNKVAQSTSLSLSFMNFKGGDHEEEESDDNATSEKEPLEDLDDTELSEEDETAVTPPPSRLCGGMIYIHPQTHMPPLSEARVTELLAMPTPPPSPLTPMSSLLPQIPSPTLPIPLPSPMPSSPLPPHTY
uniref:Uncharacterized protein n=1 Tax=Tanacetum cinerariifolium TaxID=118510 RepID=A0A699KDG4_TANCI|nr:hypothetical protein [Tanacetum cinerariifolium]